MANPIKMLTFHGVRDAKKVEDREYREIEGTGLAVARGGRVFLDDDFPQIDAFPWINIIRDDGIYRAHVPAAVAIAWLTLEDRTTIRAEAAGVHRSSDPEIMTLVARYNVWGWAIAHITATDEDDLVILEKKPLHKWEGKTVERREAVRIDDYKTFLFEFSRPPSKGGNTTALHTHTIWIGDEKFSFFARGARKFIFKGDAVCFDFIRTEDGYSNILSHTVICRDASGKVVLRGDRRTKLKLRTSPTRLPSSQRDARA